MEAVPDAGHAPPAPAPPPPPARSNPAAPYRLPPGQTSPPLPPAPPVAAPHAAPGAAAPYRLPPDRTFPPHPPAPPDAAPHPAPGPVAPPVQNRPDEPLIRPYVITGGRTHAGRELAIEALTLTTEKGRALAHMLVSEQAAICRMCETPISIAEVSALLAVPLGVARVLIADMSHEGLVSVITPRQQDGHPIEVLQKVLEGLRRL
ncbi:DUF742 domain-containing protein [Actinoallomurus spadix]|nr:DUF742 domain-containing protein [Actinoallomurus spadix]MCO5989619.1 DUF742 domain-containing protein [Actinoallomurus spadix]